MLTLGLSNGTRQTMDPAPLPEWCKETSERLHLYKQSHVTWSAGASSPVTGLSFTGNLSILTIASCWDAGARQWLPHATPVLLSACSSPDANLRQCAVYGLGVIAQHRPEAFRSIAADAISAIMTMLTSATAKSASLHCLHLPCICCAHCSRLSEQIISQLAFASSVYKIVLS